MAMKASNWPSTRLLLGLGPLLALMIASAAHAETAAVPCNANPAALPVTVFEAARIITMEPSAPTARFVAVRGDVILGAADTLADLSPWKPCSGWTVDRQFARDILMPGLVDPHVHPMQAAVMYNIPFIAPDDWVLPTGNFPGARAPADYRTKLRAMLAASDARPFITWGHHKLFHGSIDRAELDLIAPDRPVIIWQRSFHEVIMNSAALRHYGLDSAAVIAEEIVRHKSDPAHANLATGEFSETALPIALDRMRPDILSPEKIRAGFAALRQNMLTSGVTTTSDMGTGIFANFDTEAGLIHAAFETPDGAARVMLMPIATQMPAGLTPDTWIADIAARYAGPHVRVDRRVKMLADGAFFAQNMMMGAPGYADGHEGKWIMPPEVVRAMATQFWDAGFDLHIHVNGDRGVDTVLDTIDTLAPRRGQTITLEHLGYSTEAQNRRIARAGLMVSAQPNYIRVLGDAYAENGLGPDRAAAINRLGSLEAKGVTLGLHSDFNMAPIDPLYLAWIATNRMTINGNIKAPTERISLDKALRAITVEAAQVIGMDAMIGSIASGKKADFTVLDRDPYVVGTARLRDIRVKAVVFEGVVHAAAVRP
ncbi:MAG: hypothetical protein RLZZ58_1622 [Pseudomonadota bacterium]